MDDIIRLPPTNNYIGSCPECGKQIWESDRIHPRTEHLKEVFKCIECKGVFTRGEIIPF